MPTLLSAIAQTPLPAKNNTAAAPALLKTPFHQPKPQEPTMHASKQISDRKSTRWLLLAMTAGALMLLSACASPNVAPALSKVCRVVLPEAALMQSRPNGALSDGLKALEAVLDQAIENQMITLKQLDAVQIQAARDLASLGDQSNATLIALQRWATEAAARCAPD